jgi:hypothetical protein
MKRGLFAFACKQDFKKHTNACLLERKVWIYNVEEVQRRPTLPHISTLDVQQYVNKQVRNYSRERGLGGGDEG